MFLTCTPFPKKRTRKKKRNKTIIITTKTLWDIRNQNCIAPFYHCTLLPPTYLYCKHGYDLQHQKKISLRARKISEIYGLLYCGNKPSMCQRKLGSLCSSQPWNRLHHILFKYGKLLLTWTSFVYKTTVVYCLFFFSLYLR